MVAGEKGHDFLRDKKACKTMAEKAHHARIRTH